MQPPKVVSNYLNHLSQIDFCNWRGGSMECYPITIFAYRGWCGRLVGCKCVICKGEKWTELGMMHFPTSVHLGTNHQHPQNHWGCGWLQAPIQHGHGAIWVIQIDTAIAVNLWDLFESEWDWGDIRQGTASFGVDFTEFKLKGVICAMDLRVMEWLQSVTNRSNCKYVGMTCNILKTAEVLVVN